MLTTPCRAPGTDPDLFFPDTPEQLSTAKALCARCPVATLCFDKAVALGTTDGVWGGVLLERGVVVTVKRKPGRPRKVQPTAA